jgi:excisionase family DNA binding protein
VGKTSDLARYAELKDVDVRTVRAWCQSGKIPAYRKGKRWRINQKFLSGMIARDGAVRFFRACFGDSNGKHPLNERDKRALEYTVLKRKFRNKEELDQFLYYAYRRDPEAYEAVSRRVVGIGGDVLIAAAWLHKFGTLTAKELARKIGISVPTLFRLRPRIMKNIKQLLQTYDPTAPTQRQSAKMKRRN